MAFEAAKLNITVGADTSQAEKGITGFSNKLNNASQKMAATGGMLSLAVTTPLVGIATAALNSAADFEQNMNVLQQVVSATGSEMQSMQDEALRLGAVTSFSAGEASEAMLELGKAGMSTEQIMASIGGVMDLAAAGGVSLAEAASLTAATLNAFHLEASESVRIADLLAATANASAADISDLGQGMQQAGFAFSMANQPVENLAASLAILTNVGLTGSDAGTALKNAFMRMMNPTAEAASLMDELGISFYDALGNMKPLPAILDNINAATAGLTSQERDAALATIFLSDGMKAMIPLLDQGSEGFNAMVGEVTEVGASSDVANARMKGLRGAIEYLSGSVESFLIGGAMPFLATMGDILITVADSITSFGELPQPIINAGLAFLGVLAAVGPLMLAVSGLTAAFAFLISPIGLVILAVAGLGAAWASNFGGLQTATTAAIDTIRPYFTELLGWIDSARSGDWGPLKDGLRGWGEQIQLAVSNFEWSDFIEKLVWAEWAPEKLAWATYIDNLEWSDFADRKLAWSDYVDKMLWSDVVETALAWSDYIDKLSWGDHVPEKFSWTEYINTFIWGDFVPEKFAWAEYVDSLVWAERVPEKFAWGTFITALAWQLYVPEKFSWAEKVDSLTWSDFVPSRFTWAEHVYKLMWEDYVPEKFAWAEKVDSLVWADFVPEKYAWATYVDSLVWADFVPEKMAWATYVDSLTWSDFIPEKMAWATYVDSLTWSDFVPEKFAWATYVDSLTWSDFVPEKYAWATYVDSLTWSDFVPGDFSWATYVSNLEWPSIPDLSWDTYVANFEWPDLPGFDWNTYVANFVWPVLPTFDWNSWIASFEWPTIPTFDWGNWIASFEWPTLPSFSWSSWISGFKWPSIPAFRWSDWINPFNWGTPPSTGGANPGATSDGSIGGAKTSKLAPLQRNSFGGDDATGRSAGLTMNVNVASMNSEMDIHSAAATLAREYQQRARLA